MSEPHSVAVLGLGLIGSIWARHLEADGVLAAAWNRTPQPEFPRWAASARKAVEVADTVLLVVSGPPAVEAVLRSIRPALASRHLVIQCSTIDPESSRAFEEQVRGCGAAYLEAPFTGSKPGAEQRKSIFYLGGDPEAWSQARPTLDRLAADQRWIGTAGQAAALKLAFNLQIVTQLEALCEALAWCRRSGIADETFFSALRTNAAWSGVMQLKEAKLRSGDFAPQFSVKHMLKDLRLALAAAPGQLPAVEIVAERLQALQDRGQGEDDMSALYRLLDE